MNVIALRRHLRLVQRPRPTVTNFQLIEGQGLRRQTPDGWQWVEAGHCIDCGTGEVFELNAAGYHIGWWHGLALGLLLGLAAVAVLAVMTASHVCS